MIKVSVHQEDITVMNVFVLNSRASIYVKQKLKKLKWEIDNFIIVFVGCNSPLSAIDATRRKLVRIYKIWTTLLTTLT